MKKGIILVATLLLCGAAWAQQIPSAPLGSTSANNLVDIKPTSNQWSLLDPSRIRWSHSYSISYFSGGNNSGSVGLLNTGMFYEFSSKLSLAVNVGLLHNPGALIGNKSDNSNASILPGFRLDYHPSEKVQMTFMFQKFSGAVSPYWYGPSLDPWYVPGYSR